MIRIRRHVASEEEIANYRKEIVRQRQLESAARRKAGTAFQQNRFSEAARFSQEAEEAAKAGARAEASLARAERLHGKRGTLLPANNNDQAVTETAPEPESTEYFHDANDDDYDFCRTLLTDFDRKVRTDAVVRGFAACVAVRSGNPDPAEESRVIRALAQDAKLMEKPWRWLVRMSKIAFEKGDYNLTAHIALVCAWWKGTVDRKISGNFAEVLDVGLYGMPNDLYAQVLSQALKGLERMAPHELICKGPSGAPPDIVEVQDARRFCAMQLVSLGENASDDPEGLTIAHALLADEG